MEHVSGTQCMNRSNNNTLRKYKLVVLGNQNVGKTTLTYKLCEDKFLDNIEATIGVDLRSCFVKVGGEDIKLEIWDTAGQERFHKSLISTYYRNVDAVIFVYDVTNQQSFDDLKIWIEESIKNGLTCIPRILIGNKCDQPAVVNRNVAQCFADANGMLLFETSCSNSDCDHVKAIFYTIAQKLKDRKPLAATYRDDDLVTHEKLTNTTNCNQNSNYQGSSCYCILL